MYRMARDRVAEILILCVNPFLDLKDDYRLNFLKKEYRLPVYHIHEYYSPTIFHTLIRSVFLNNIYIRKPGGLNSNIFYKIMRFPARALRSIINRISERVFLSKTLFYTEEWARNLLKLIKPSVLVFDYVHLAIPIIDVLLRESKKLGIRSIFLPHGVPLFTDAVMRERKVGRGYVFEPTAACDPDAIVVPHNQSVSAFTRIDVDPERLPVLGSARFCREWTDILSKICPRGPFDLPKSKGKLNVLYIERGNDRYGDRKGLVEETFIKISKLDYVNFVIKPHPRSNKMYFEGLPRTIRVIYDIDSVNLCKWADVVLCLVSSISIEVLVQDKVLIYPKYMDDTPLIMDEMHACWVVKEYEELEEAFLKIRNDPSLRNYKQEDVSNFLTEVVYGGNEGRDVLGDYENLILKESMANETRKS
jgi:hypothetical protein